MKKYLLLFLVISAAALVYAQDIPNSGFESWSNGNPDNWLTNNVPGFFTPVTQSNDAHSGASAVRLEVMSFGGFTVPPTLYAGDEGVGIPVNGRPGSFTGFYKFQPLGDREALNITVALYRNSQQEAVGGNTISISTPAAGYTQFTLPIVYFTDSQADSAYIVFAVSDTTGEFAGTIGSFAVIDDVAFGGATDVDDISGLPLQFNLKQNYPNPFNPSTTIEYEIPSASFVELKVYDLLGSEVAALVNKEQQPGRYNINFDASSLTSGIYLYKLSATGDAINYSKTSKMILMK